MTALIMLFEVALYAIAGSAIGLVRVRYAAYRKQHVPHARI